MRANAKKIYIEQVSWTLPESFHKSGLAPSYRERIVEQWVSDSAACMADTLAEYAQSTDVPLSKMISDDGSFRLKGEGSSSEFDLNFYKCVEGARVAAEAALP